MDRRTLLLRGGAGLAAVTLAAPYISRARAATTLRFAHFAPEDHPAHVAAKQFAAKIAERTKGELKVDIFPNNQLGDPPQQAQQIKLGVIDMGLPTQGQLDKFEKAFAAIPLPFAFDSSAHAFRVLDGPVMQWLAPLAEKQGFITLRNWEYGFRNITTASRPINTADDVKGLKIRTPPDLQIQAAMEALGGIVTTIAFSELYLALSQKVVDGQENPIAIIFFNKYYEVQKNLALTRHVYNNMIHTVSAASWAKLSPDNQKIFREESESAGNLMRKLIGDQEEDQIKQLTGFGMAVTKPDPGPFRAKMEPAYKKIAAYAGEEAVQKFQAMVEQGRKG
jgi:tripartite ATP-independent transporter DctP family solute receptor